MTFIFPRTEFVGSHLLLAVALAVLVVDLVAAVALAVLVVDLTVA